MQNMWQRFGSWPCLINRHTSNHIGLGNFKCIEIAKTIEKFRLHMHKHKYKIGLGKFQHEICADKKTNNTKNRRLILESFRVIDGNIYNTLN